MEKLLRRFGIGVLVDILIGFTAYGFSLAGVPFAINVALFAVGVFTVLLTAVCFLLGCIYLLSIDHTHVALLFWGLAVAFGILIKMYITSSFGG